MEPAAIRVSSCRVCGSKNITNDVLTKRYYLINLDRTVAIPYSVCNDCQFIFQGTYVGDEFLNHYYKNSPMLRRGDHSKYEDEQNERQSAFLQRNLRIDGISVLEIGAHQGAFLQHLHRAHNCVSYFDDLSEESRRLLATKEGLRDARNEKDLKVDLIILRHVFEHIHDLPSFVSEVDKMLKKDGHLFIEVPDWTTLDVNTDPLIFEHLSQFNSTNITNLFRKLGWQCEALEKCVCPDDPTTPNRVQRLIFKRTALPPLGSKEFAQTFLNHYENHEGFGDRRINEIIKDIPNSKTIALYPASHLTFAALNETKLLEKNVIGMFDIDAKKHGKVVNGVTIKEAGALKELQPDYIFLFTMAFEPEIRESFKEMGLRATIYSITDILAGKV